MFHIVCQLCDLHFLLYVSFTIYNTNHFLGADIYRSHDQSKADHLSQ